MHGSNTAHYSYINSLIPGKSSWNPELVIFKLMSRIHILSSSCEIARAGECHKTSQIISQHQVMTWCNKPLPEPVLTQIYVAIWCHKTTFELTTLDGSIVKIRTYPETLPILSTLWHFGTHSINVLYHTANKCVKWLLKCCSRDSNNKSIDLTAVLKWYLDKDLIQILTVTWSAMNHDKASWTRRHIYLVYTWFGQNFRAFNPTS